MPFCLQYFDKIAVNFFECRFRYESYLNQCIFWKCMSLIFVRFFFPAGNSKNRKNPSFCTLQFLRFRPAASCTKKLAILSEYCKQMGILIILTGHVLCSNMLLIVESWSLFKYRNIKILIILQHVLFFNSKCFSVCKRIVKTIIR